MDSEKTNGADWLKVILSNNPDGEMPENNPVCPKWREKRRLNNEMSWADNFRVKNNPADKEHPLWFDWAMNGMKYKPWMNVQH